MTFYFQVLLFLFCAPSILVLTSPILIGRPERVASTPHHLILQNNTELIPPVASPNPSPSKDYHHHITVPNTNLIVNMNTIPSQDPTPILGEEFYTLLHVIRIQAQYRGPKTPLPRKGWNSDVLGLSFKMSNLTPVSHPEYLTFGLLEASMTALRSYVRKYELWYTMEFDIYNDAVSLELAKGSIKNLEGETAGGTNGTAFTMKETLQVFR